MNRQCCVRRVTINKIRYYIIPTGKLTSGQIVRKFEKNEPRDDYTNNISVYFNYDLIVLKTKRNIIICFSAVSDVIAGFFIFFDINLYEHNEFLFDFHSSGKYIILYYLYSTLYY